MGRIKYSKNRKEWPLTSKYGYTYYHIFGIDDSGPHGTVKGYYFDDYMYSDKSDLTYSKITEFVNKYPDVDRVLIRVYKYNALMDGPGASEESIYWRGKASEFRDSNSEKETVEENNKMVKEDFKQGVEKDIYNLVVEMYYNMSKEELMTIAVEAIYQLKENVSDSEFEEAVEEVREVYSEIYEDSFDDAYDFVSRNYYSMSNSELKTIAAEFIYQLYNRLDEETYKKLSKEIEDVYNDTFSDEDSFDEDFVDGEESLEEAVEGEEKYYILNITLPTLFINAIDLGSGQDASVYIYKTSDNMYFELETKNPYNIEEEEFKPVKYKEFLRSLVEGENNKEAIAYIDEYLSDESNWIELSEDGEEQLDSLSNRNIFYDIYYEAEDIVKTINKNLLCLFSEKNNFSKIDIRVIGNNRLDTFWDGWNGEKSSDDELEKNKKICVEAGEKLLEKINNSTDYSKQINVVYNGLDNSDRYPNGYKIELEIGDNKDSSLEEATETGDNMHERLKVELEFIDTSVLDELNDVWERLTFIDRGYSKYSGGPSYSLVDVIGEWDDILEFLLNDSEVGYGLQLGYDAEDLEQILKDMREGAEVMSSYKESTRIENSITRLTERELLQLREEVSLGSSSTEEYNNTLGIKPEDALKFFKGYLNHLKEMDNTGSLNEEDVIDNFDNRENLLSYWYMVQLLGSFNESSLTERAWKYKEKMGVTLRDYLDKEDYANVLRTVYDIAKKYKDLLGEDDYASAFEELFYLVEGEWDIVDNSEELSDIGFDSPEELVDERLEMLYDACDDNRVWIDII